MPSRPRSAVTTRQPVPFLADSLRAGHDARRGARRDRKRGIGENLGRYASKDEGRNAPSSARRHRDKVAACFGGGAHDCAVRLVVFGANDLCTTSAACAIACAAASVCSACFMCRRCSAGVSSDLLGGQRKGVKRLRDRHERDLRPRLGGRETACKSLPATAASRRSEPECVDTCKPPLRDDRLLGPRRQRLIARAGPRGIALRQSLPARRSPSGAHGARMGECRTRPALRQDRTWFVRPPPGPPPEPSSGSNALMSAFDPGRVLEPVQAAGGRSRFCPALAPGACGTRPFWLREHRKATATLATIDAAQFPAARRVR